ncbi:unnamed protein product [Darwinula stevensoni]|uniref:Tonsoku-like protein n=1 Tax=Darwinula stevensoni TaxID=69355 RepID=A0A7R8XC11_9CRUS|nr:unnamed protein product [Darwinula stevensoni]CAG0892074.1 unnamed protein product [Darwinula stevensoni]
MKNDLKEIKDLLAEKERAKAKGDFREAANICNVLGRLYLGKEHYHEALKQHEEEAELSEILGDREGEGVAHRKIGEVHLLLGNDQQALQHQLTHLELSEKVGSDVEKQRALATLGNTYLTLAQRAAHIDPGIVERHLKKAKDSFQESNKALSKYVNQFLVALYHPELKGSVTDREWHQMKCRLLLNFGIVEEMSKNLEQSVHFLREAVDISSEYLLNEDCFRSRYNLATVYKKLGEHEPAHEQVEEAVRLGRGLGDHDSLCDALILEAHVLVCCHEYRAAKKPLLSARKLRLSPQKREALEKQLKAAVKLYRADSELFSLEREMRKERRAIYEKMADLCCTLECYPIAVELYMKVLELLSEKEDKAPIYVSLALTYKDDGQLDKAAEFYEKELRCHMNNPAEACRTLLNLSICKEKDGYAAIRPLYEEAVKRAEAAKDVKLKVRALENLSVVQENFRLSEEARKTRTEANNLRQEHGIESSEEDEEADQEIEDDSDVELSASDLEEEQEVMPRATERQAARKQKSLMQPVDDYGNTQLHKACQDGNLAQVENLLNQGHKVNVRDKAGWLPLHDSAWKGHAEIVKLLLDKGAWMNDRGGRDCDGRTPLHEASRWGQLDVVRILLDRGASVTVQDVNGDRALDCLRAWREEKGPVDAELNECVALESCMIDLMQKAGCDSSELTKSPEVTGIAVVGEAGPSGRGGRSLRCGVTADEDMRAGLHRDRRSRMHNKVGVSLYREAIRNVKSMATRNRQKSRVWDLSRMQKQEGRHASRSQLRNEEDEPPSDWLVPDEEEIPVVSPSIRRGKDHSDATVLSHAPLQLPFSIISAPLQFPKKELKVKLYETEIKVVVLQGENPTCSWLSQNLNELLLKTHGNSLEFEVELTDKGGNALEEMQTIRGLLDRGVQICAALRPAASMVLPLKEIYKFLTHFFWEVPSVTLMERLDASGMSGCLDVSGIPLAGKPIRPLTTSLHWAPHLTGLCLAKTPVWDMVALEEWRDVIGRLRELNFLDLHCCGLVPFHIETLLTPMVNTLEEVDLGYNALGEEGSDLVTNLLTCNGHLRILRLIDCDLGPEFFSSRLCAALRGTPLKELDVSWNPIEEEGLRRLVNSCNPDALTRLIASNVLPNPPLLSPILCLKLTSLVHLDLSHNRVKSSMVLAHQSVSLVL